MQITEILKDAKGKLVGLKQTLRGIQQNKVSLVYLANDVEENIVRTINKQCQEKGIPLIPVNLTQKELGRICQIEVGAAVVSLVQ